MNFEYLQRNKTETILKSPLVERHIPNHRSVVANLDPVLEVVQGLVAVDGEPVLALGADPDVVDARVVLVVEAGVGAHLARGLARRQLVQVLDVLLAHEGRVRGVALAGVEVAGQSDGQIGAELRVDGLDHVHRHADLVGPRLAAGVVQVSVGADEPPSGCDVFKNGNVHDAVASRAPVLRGRVRCVGKPLRLGVLDLENVLFVDDGVELPSLVSVVAAHADACPAVAKGRHDVVELFLERLLQTDDGNVRDLVGLLDYELGG